MLTKQEKRKIAEATLYNDLDKLNVRFDIIKEVQEFHEAVVIMKSGMGFIANQMYDGLKELTDDYNEFVKLVFTEVDDEYFRLIMMLLENNLPIEDELNKYVLNLIDKY